MALLRSTSVLLHPTPSFPLLAPLLSARKLGCSSLGLPRTLSVSIKGDSLRFVCPLFGSGSGLGSSRRRRQCRGAVCYAAPLSPETIQWVSAVSCAVLMLAKGTAIQKSFLVPLFALQAPTSAISWIKGEYGTWTAFLALLVRLFYFIPGELDLPFLTMLLVIVSPYQTINLRGTQTGAIISLVISGYLAFQHFSRTGNLRRAFDQGSIIATFAIICITVVSLLFFI